MSEDQQSNIDSRIRSLARWKPGRNFSVFLFCVATAVLFWFLKTFTKDYQTTLEVPVRYTELPEGKVVMNDLPDVLRLKVEAYGFVLLGQYLGGTIDTVEIACSHLTENESGAAFLSTRSVLGDITDQIADQITVQQLLTDSIYFRFDREITRRLEVKPDIQMSFAEQYQMVGQPNIIPTTVDVTGPASVISSLDVLPTQTVVLENLSKSAVQRVGFVELSGLNNVRYNPREVLIKIPVDKFTETSLKVPVTAINVPEGLELKTYPPEVEVTFTVPFSKYEKIVAENLQAVVDYSEVTRQNKHRLQVDVPVLPEHAQFVRCQPAKVEFRLKKE